MAQLGDDPAPLRPRASPYGWLGIDIARATAPIGVGSGRTISTARAHRTCAGRSMRPPWRADSPARVRRQRGLPRAEGARARGHGTRASIASARKLARLLRFLHTCGEDYGPARALDDRSRPAELLEHRAGARTVKGTRQACGHREAMRAGERKLARATAAPKRMVQRWQADEKDGGRAREGAPSGTTDRRARSRRPTTSLTSHFD